ncbi:hypothetical protein [Pseudoxanthomonas spadix]|uniref:hypothetical protein n=1 Tax=Pseudoxanthomonas spadix TaxID=415229 RepID=UPI001EE63A69|nr:hypothetical protein [Pseudoxanthomonas spadix]
MLDGNDPREFVHSLFEAGYDRFYVKVPKGFRVSIFPIDPYPPGYQLLGIWQPAQEPVRPDGNQSQVRYVQLDTSQLRDLIEYPPIALHELSGGGLESALQREGLLPIDFTYRRGLPGALLPTERAIADRVPSEFDASSGVPMVVKTLNRNRSQHSYVLHGVSFKDIFVEESALDEVLDRMRAAKAVPVSVREDLPDDPHGLKESSPLVYEILCKAYQNRGKPKKEIEASMLAAEFKQLNYKYAKNPMPFNNGRHDFAANLANPTYAYLKKPPKLREPLPEPVTIQPDKFLDQDFINEGLKKLLYAACCWGDRKEPLLGQDPMKLVDLLRGLGFRDADENDPVQRMVYFIVGELVPRRPPDTDFRDARGDRS